jgi:hypothetical protein
MWSLHIFKIRVRVLDEPTENNGEWSYGVALDDQRYRIEEDNVTSGAVSVDQG